MCSTAHTYGIMFSAAVILLCKGNNDADFKTFIVFIVWAFKVTV
jgi:hypothetical protein